eukprot:TRINITY_DN87472_c0_g1_i1.p1 TRINITY_DN87472_c0_g1~~TRINITY_DN87472_c0_g1_i1.p1  ORF type:complete len:264 (-),score=-3.79 TRINITY_DN87472_c0_g1_i1:259-1050(-)
MTSGETGYYFAFGSNLNPKTLKKRKVSPIESFPCIVWGWQLSYRYAAFACAEPAFFTVERAPPDVCVHGVCHKMTVEDIAQIRRTEGGGGHEGVPGYVWADVEVEPYESAPNGIKCVAQTLASMSCILRTGCVISKRYKDKVLEGADVYKLAPEWKAYLESMPIFKPTIGSRIITVILAVPVVPLAALLMTTGARWTHTAFAGIKSLTWFLHDHGPGFLNGSITVPPQGKGHDPKKFTTLFLDMQAYLAVSGPAPANPHEKEQ